VKLSDVIEIIKGLSDAGVTVWVDGGWCVDALVGRALREHNDLDIAINRQDEKTLQDWLTSQGYTDRPSPDKSAWNYVVGNDKGCLIDIHVFEFDGEGNHIYGVAYPRESLTGHAMLGGIRINCIPPDWMFHFKTGYAPVEKDIIDIQALAEKYGYEIPDTHRTEVRRSMNTPDPTRTHPVPGFPVTYIKPTVTRPNIIVGDFTYYSGEDFESRVTHHYEFYGDRLIIGKFCQIASGVEFVMNGTNHKMNAVNTFPFYILEGWNQETPPLSEFPCKGDTVIGNDVWIGQNATILPGVHIGDGAIIGLNSVVGSNVEPYTIVAGNPAKLLRKRFDDELISLLEKLKWWDKPIDEIQTLIPLLSDSDVERVKEELRNLI
jgi:virginiamycin A acetyltransferase